MEIRDTDDTTVLDAFSFSNVIQMTDVLSSAIGANNTMRIQALADPLAGPRPGFVVLRMFA